MKASRIVWGTALMALVLALAGCKNEDDGAAQGPAPAQSPDADKKLTELNTRLTELAFEQDSLKKKVDKLESRDRELASLELEIEQAKRKVDRLEAQLFPPDKPSVKDLPPEIKKQPEAAKKPKSAKKKDVEVPEPVPILAKAKADGQAADKPGEDGGGAEAIGDGQVGESGDNVELAVPVGELSLVNVKFAPAVNRQTRQVDDERTVFKTSDNRVYAWLVFSNKADEETKVVLRWKHGGNEISSIELRVGRKTSHWRTWAYIKPHPKLLGEWQVELVDMAGNLLGTATFMLEE